MVAPILAKRTWPVTDYYFVCLKASLCPRRLGETTILQIRYSPHRYPVEGSVSLDRCSAGFCAWRRFSRTSDARLFCDHAAMPRRLEWIKSQNFQGLSCSQCNWKFRPSGAVAGDSLVEMVEEYETQCDKEFAAHVCANHPRPKRAKEGAQRGKGKYWKLP
jgi:hypothetical protein